MKNQTEFVEALGPHVVLDCYGCDPWRLASLEEVYGFLDRTPDLLGMHKVMPPYVLKFAPDPPCTAPDEDAGISGFVIIAESHISLHSWPEKRFLSVDVFSCKVFDVDGLVKEVCRSFKVESFKSHVFSRGIEFPRNIPAVVGYMNKNRLGRFG